MRAVSRKTTVTQPKNYLVTQFLRNFHILLNFKGNVISKLHIIQSKFNNKKIMSWNGSIPPPINYRYVPAAPPPYSRHGIPHRAGAGPPQTNIYIARPPGVGIPPGVPMRQRRVELCCCTLL